MQTPKELIEKTIWIVPWNNEYIAVDSKGDIVDSNKYKSTLEFIIRKRAAQTAQNIWAIAVAVAPNKRQPNRTLPNRKHR